MSIVSIKNVTVRYDSYTALESANLEILEDDFIGIIGPNGGGKTTLIKSIIGSIPYSGEVRLSPTLFKNGKRLIGYLPQQTTFDSLIDGENHSKAAVTLNFRLSE